MKSVHEARLAECEKIRADYEEGFVKEDKECSDPWNRYFVNARGNRQELEKFRQMTEFTDEDKRLMLDTLRDKDFLDTTAEVLASYLRVALPYKNNFCTELYQKYLLAPRAGHEKLMGSRSRIVSLLSEKISTGWHSDCKDGMGVCKSWLKYSAGLWNRKLAGRGRWLHKM